ncbi:MAG: hypothetical protein QXZ10_01510 [Sulfolobales archaeon]
MIYIPTVHLSVPDQLYRELRSKAEELGIQVTDLIKVYVMIGLKKDLGGGIGEGQNNLREEFNSRIIYIEGRLSQISKLIENLINKISDLESRIEELETPDIISEVVTSRRKD